MEKAVFEWIASTRAVNVPVSGALIKEKAVAVDQLLVKQYENADAEVKNKLHLDALSTFTASGGWYSNFMRRFQLKSGKLQGRLLFSCVTGLLVDLSNLLVSPCIQANRLMLS